MQRQQQMMAGLLLGAVLFSAGCGPTSTGHTDDKTPGGTPTPPMDALMDTKAFNDYGKQQAAEAKNKNPNKKLGLPDAPK